MKEPTITKEENVASLKEVDYEAKYNELLTNYNALSQDYDTLRKVTEILLNQEGQRYAAQLYQNLRNQVLKEPAPENK